MLCLSHAQLYESSDKLFRLLILFIMYTFVTPDVHIILVWKRYKMVLSADKLVISYNPDVEALYNGLICR